MSIVQISPSREQMGVDGNLDSQAAVAQQPVQDLNGSGSRWGQECY